MSGLWDIAYGFYGFDERCFLEYFSNIFSIFFLIISE
jgi:hypothetical protein